MAAAAAMLFTSAISHHCLRSGRRHRALHRREFLQGNLRVQIGEEQLQGHEQLQGSGLGLHDQGRLHCRQGESQGLRSKRLDRVDTEPGVSAPGPVLSMKLSGFGLGLRTPHYEAILNEPHAIDWLEVITENYLVPGGKPLHYLERIRERFPAGHARRVPVHRQHRSHRF